MNKKEAIVIINNYNHYFRMFSEANNMLYQSGDLEWVMPQEGSNGPAIVFNVQLKKDMVQEKLAAINQRLKDRSIPSLWFLTPLSSPPNIKKILIEHDFKECSMEGENVEPCMLLYKKDFNQNISINRKMKYKKIYTKQEFKLWIDVVNEALHGYEMLDVDHYYNWIKTKSLTCYLGEMDGIPVATVATIQNGKFSSLEFVSTLEEYRGNKISRTLCKIAITDLLKNGAEIVTLGSSPKAVTLYKHLGFHCCFNQVLMEYKNNNSNEQKNLPTGKRTNDENG